MITGFNTDIEFNGITYHVQTEDKGLDTPLILSLVYDRGTILASKRSPYDDLLTGEFDEKTLAERLQKQHKLICAAIRAGRIEDLKRMSMKESAKKENGLRAQKAVPKTPDLPPAEQEQPLETPVPSFLTDLSEPIASPSSDNLRIDLDEILAEEKFEAAIPKPKDDLLWDVSEEIVSETFFEDVEVIDEELILPDDAVEIITDFAKHEQPAPEELAIEILNEGSFKSGERKTLNIRIFRGSVPGIGGAHVIIKILGSSFRPLIFHSKTDSNGIATAHLQIPQFKSGRAAVLIKAMSGGEVAELRRIIRHG